MQKDIESEIINGYYLDKFKREYGLNYILDPQIDFEEIPLPFRHRLFSPKTRKKNDPIAFKKLKGKVVVVFK